MVKVSQEELLKSIQYLDQLDQVTLEKGQVSMDFSEETNGGKEEQIKKLQGEFNDHISKAKEIKAELDKLQKADELEKMEDKESPSEEEKPEGKKSSEGKKPEEKPELEKEEIIKSVRESILGEVTDLIKSKDQEIQILSQKLEKISNEPIKKSFTGGELNYVDRFLKSKSEGRTPLLKSSQKSTISNHMYNLFIETSDEILKSQIGDAITMYESSGELDPQVRSLVQSKYGLEIIDQ